MNMIIYKRNCPKCGKELTTPNKHYYNKAISENKCCQSCALLGKPFSEEHKKNLSRNHADIRGDKNPFKGKRHTKESIDKMLKTRNNHPTWKENSSKSMKMVRELYWSDSNPMDNPESVKKIRLKRIEDIELKRNTQIVPNYNINSIPILEEYARNNGYIIQHAENGGEFYIKDLGYWVDAYDKENNVVIEYDEQYHFNKDGSYISDDLRRQEEIQTFLKCKFIRIGFDGSVKIFDF